MKESVRWCWWSGTNSQSKQSLCDDQEDMTTCVREELQERPHQTPDVGDKTWRHLENNVKYFIAAPGIPVESYKRYLLCGRAVARCTDSLLSDRQMIDTYRHSRPQQTQTIISTFTPPESREQPHTTPERTREKLPKSQDLRKYICIYLYSPSILYIQSVCLESEMLLICSSK